MKIKITQVLLVGVGSPDTNGKYDVPFVLEAELTEFEASALHEAWLDRDTKRETDPVMRAPHGRFIVLEGTTIDDVDTQFAAELIGVIHDVNRARPREDRPALTALYQERQHRDHVAEIAGGIPWHDGAF